MLHVANGPTAWWLGSLRDGESVELLVLRQRDAVEGHVLRGLVFTAPHVNGTVAPEPEPCLLAYAA